jgi:hypothetical protein
MDLSARGTSTWLDLVGFVRSQHLCECDGIIGPHGWEYAVVIDICGRVD